MVPENIVDTIVCLGYTGMRVAGSPTRPTRRKELLLKHILSAFFSTFSAVLSIVPQTVFRIRSTAVLTILVAAVASLAAHAQSSQWTWMGGSSVLTQHDNGEYGEPGTYGTQGQPSAANIPGGRLGAVSWTDKDGNFGFSEEPGLIPPRPSAFSTISGNSTLRAKSGHGFREAIRSPASMAASLEYTASRVRPQPQIRQEGARERWARRMRMETFGFSAEQASTLRAQTEI
jgi:hypothetical protein